MPQTVDMRTLNANKIGVDHKCYKENYAFKCKNIKRKKHVFYINGINVGGLYTGCL